MPPPPSTSPTFTSPSSMIPSRPPGRAPTRLLPTGSPCPPGDGSICQRAQTSLGSSWLSGRVGQMMRAAGRSYKGTGHPPASQPALQGADWRRDGPGSRAEAAARVSRQGDARPATGWLAPAGMAVMSGLVVGGVVSILAFLLARYGPAGDGWSFRGNGALAAYALVPASLAGGWAAVVLRSRSHPRWLAWGAAAGVVGLAIAAADAALVPVLGQRANSVAGPVLLLALAAWAALAPLLAATLPAPGVTARAGVVPHLLAAVGWGAGNLGGLSLVGLALAAV